MVIETDRLTKLYGRKTGCTDVSISVGEGEIYGFLGPNGAGKSTFVKMLTGLLLPTSGSAFILGRPAGDVRIRSRIGYLPEGFRYQEWMTGEDLLSFHSSLYKLDKNRSRRRIAEVLDLVGLSAHAGFKIGTYSKGMQQRIGLASALLPDPDILFLDEPTSALDPIGRKEVREIILTLKSRGKTIFLNSHLLSEVEMICTSIAVINNGRIVEQGRMNDLLGSNTILEVHAADISPELFRRLQSRFGSIIRQGDTMKMKIENLDDIHEAAGMVLNGGGRLYGLTPCSESLEQRFIALVEGKNQAEGKNLVERKNG